MHHQSPPEAGQALNRYACTMDVDNYYEAEAKILENVRKVALPKYALPGIAWQARLVISTRSL